MSRRGKCMSCDYSSDRCKCRRNYCSIKESERNVITGCLPCPQAPDCPTDQLRFFKLKRNLDANELMAQPLLTLRSCEGSWHFPNEPDARYTFWFIISNHCEFILVMPECSMKSFPIGSEFRLILDLKC